MLGHVTSSVYLEISMVVVVEGVEIRCRCWNVGTPPPVGEKDMRAILNGRTRRGCVTFNVSKTLHFHTSKGQKEEEKEERHDT